MELYFSEFYVLPCFATVFAGRTRDCAIVRIFISNASPRLATVAFCVRDAEAAGSNPVNPTTKPQVRREFVWPFLFDSNARVESMGKTATRSQRLRSSENKKSAPQPQGQGAVSVAPRI